MHFVFVFGPPAVGKMTVGRELAARTGYKLLHNHMTVEPVLGDLRVRLAAVQPPVDGVPPAGPRGGPRRRPRRPGVHLGLGARAGRGPRPRLVVRRPGARPRAGGCRSSSCTPTLGERLDRNRTELRLAEKRSKRDLEFSARQRAALDGEVRHEHRARRPHASARTCSTGHEHVRIDNTTRSAADVAAEVVEALGL